MLRISVTIVPEEWDAKTETFIDAKTQTLQLEHSLVSLQKWESNWCKSFLHTKNKTDEEIIDYIKCMTVNTNVNPDIYDHLSNENIREIQNYIDAPMTATTFSNERNGAVNREIVTAELIYYWIIALNIPFECRKWHLNQLLTLIRVCNIKNAPQKKMSQRDIMSRNAAINAARRKQLNTKG